MFICIIRGYIWNNEGEEGRVNERQRKRKREHRFTHSQTELEIVM